MRSKILFLLTAAMVLAGIGAAALAGGGKAGHGVAFRPAMFEWLDANTDGAVTWDEVSARRGARFEVLDGDGNGAVTRGELERALTRRLDRLFSRFDTDMDGQVTRTEFNSAALVKFNRFDPNSDGRVTRAEFDKTGQDWQIVRVRMRQMARDFWGGPAKQ